MPSRRLLEIAMLVINEMCLVMEGCGHDLIFKVSLCLSQHEHGPMVDATAKPKLPFNAVPSDMTLEALVWSKNSGV